MAKKRNMSITAEYVRSVLEYNPETGVFIWKKRPKFEDHRATKGWNTKYAGKISGNILATGYRVIVINYVDYLAHRLAWLYMTGEWPKEEIDHKDLDRGNNKFSNLREANPSQNLANLKLGKTNTSGHKGVYWNTSAKKWQAYMSINNKSKYLGVYSTKEEAHDAYCVAAVAHRGEFARTR